MTVWLAAIILGIIEGITEFIPVSSTGHLLLAEHFLSLDGKLLHETFFGTEVFNAVIQAGAMLAALPLFSDRLATLKRWKEPVYRDYFFKMALAFVITGIGGVIMSKRHWKLPHTVWPIALAILIGGVLFVLVEQWLRGRKTGTEITWTLAIVFGFAQLLAVFFPGASRSGCTILLALVLGLNRTAATEFSFLLGVPTLCAAAAKTLLDALKDHEVILWGPLLLSTLVAAVFSIFAVRWLLRYVQSRTFTGFGVYRIALGVILLVLVQFALLH